MAGGHIDGNTNNPAENVGQWKAGQGRPICVFSAARLAPGPKVTDTMAWSDIPTCKEQASRSTSTRCLARVYLPPGVPAEAVAFWSGVLKKVFETDDWKEYIARTSQSGTFLTGESSASSSPWTRTAAARSSRSRAGW